MPITWHLSDPDSTTFGNQRQRWLGQTGTPTVVFDGYEPVVGGNASTMYDTYAPIADAHLLDASPLSLVAEYEIVGDQFTVSVTATVVDPATDDKLTLRVVVVEDDAHDGHDNVARLLLAEEPFRASSPGETMTLSRTFTVDPAWVADNVGVIAFVESDVGSKPVLQATRALPDILAVVTVEAEPAGIGAAWTLEGPADFSRSGADDFAVPVFVPGVYTLTWGDVPGWTAPSPATRTIVVGPDEAPVVSGRYTGGPFRALLKGDVGYTGASLGVAMADIDGDGDPDIHVVNDGAADLLLLNDGDGGFTDTARGLLAAADAGRAAAWADYDSDGDLDCYLSRHGQANLLLRNDSGSFVDATFGAVGDPGPGAGVSWTDFDLDGQLDLYLVNDGAENVLFRSFGAVGGNWFFLPQSGATAVAGDGVASAWADYDGDGDQDGFTSVDGQADVMLVNNQPFGFAVDAIEALEGPAQGFSAGAAWADFDDDGAPDLYTAVDGLSDRLLRSSGDSFVPVGAQAMTAASPSRGVAWGDYDNDGDQDLYLSRRGQHDRLMRNEGGGLFTPIPLGVAALGGASAGAAWGDVDRDGDLDLYVAVEDGPNVLLLNRAADGAHWLHVDLVNAAGSVSPVGAKVRMVADGVSRHREVSAGSGYFSQDSGTVEFGLGAAAWVDTLEIRWPDGDVQYLLGLAPDRRYGVVQGRTTAVDDGRPPARTSELDPPHPNPFNPATTISWTLAEAGPLSLRIYDPGGRLVHELVASGQAPAGRGSAVWTGRDRRGREMPAGVYLARLKTVNGAWTQRLTLVK